MKKVGVFCGARTGSSATFAEATSALGRSLANRGHGIVYGGGRVGLMGILADAALAAGGQVTGVIPQALADAEIAHEGLTHLHVVNSMHERKALMAQLSDAFIALPGGYGTLDELCEIVTWAQLGIHDKPIGLLNVNRYYDRLIELFDLGMREGFIPRGNRALIREARTIDHLLERLGL